MIIEQLACSLNCRDERPNIALAEKLAKTKNKTHIKELFDLLDHKNKTVSSDAIKVISEVGMRDPLLIKGYIPDLVKLLESKNNRLQWGAMAALDEISNAAPERIFNVLPQIISAAEKGSVITRDRCVRLLLKLAAHKKYRVAAIPLLFEILLRAPDNQFAMYSEEIFPVLHTSEHKSFQKILNERLPELEKDSQVKRVRKVIKGLTTQQQ